MARFARRGWGLWCIALICGGGDTLIFWVRRGVAVLGVGRRFGWGAFARGLVLLQLAEAAVNGTLEVALVAGQLGEGISRSAIGAEGPRQEITGIGRDGFGRRRIVVHFGLLFFEGMHGGTGMVLALDIAEAVAVESGFEGDGAMQAPMGEGDAEDQALFGAAYGLEAVEMLLEDFEQFAGIFRFHEVLAGARRAGDSVAAGCGFAFGGAGAGGMRRVAAVGVSLRIRGCAWIVWIGHWMRDSDSRVDGVHGRFAGADGDCVDDRGEIVLRDA